jgi:hypothetical protein
MAMESQNIVWPSMLFRFTGFFPMRLIGDGRLICPGLMPAKRRTEKI